jgi:hypothetical protein
VPENSRLLRKDGGSATQVGAFPPPACNMRILVIRYRFRICYCFLVVGAREADRLAEFALRGVRGERSRVAGDPYGASLWFRLADPGRYGSVSWTGCLSGTRLGGSCLLELLSRKGNETKTVSRWSSMPRGHSVDLI